MSFYINHNRKYHLNDDANCIFSLQTVALYDFHAGEVRQRWTGHSKEVTKVIIQHDTGDNYRRS